MLRTTRDLEAAGTRSVRKTALNSFQNFLSEGGLEMEVLDKTIQEGGGVRVLLRVIDAYGMYLISRKLKTNSILSYFGNTKNFLLEKYPEIATVCSVEVSKVRKRIEKFCNKRQSSVPTKQATPLRVEDLAEVVRTLYASATHEVDYFDAALLLMMWSFFGRSSDTLRMKKDQFKVIPGGALLLEFSRLKTGTIQGLTFYKYKNNMLLCPVYSLAVSIIMKESPNTFLVNAHILSNFEEDDFSSFEVDVAALLEADSSTSVLPELENDVKTKQIGLSAYVNRLLKRARELNDCLPSGLSSHSFRTGGGAAQHANANSTLSLQWIIDRGGWQMSSINKAFSYIINSSKEDQKVAKYLGVGIGREYTPTVFNTFTVFASKSVYFSQRNSFFNLHWIYRYL